EHVEVTPAIEDPRVRELKLPAISSAPRIFLNQHGVGKRCLRILVEALHVGMGRGGIKVVVAFFDVFAVVALRTSQPIEPLLDKRIFSIPECERENQSALPVAPAEQSVLAPAISAPAGQIVREVAPGVAIGGVILAHRAPLPLCEIGAPALPVFVPAILLN